MQTRVPGRFESEKLSVIPGHLHHLAREETQRQHTRVIVHVIRGLGIVPDPSHHQLPDLFPLDLTRGLVDNCDTDPSLNALMQQEQSTARQLIAVLDDSGHVLSVGRQFTNLEPHEDVVLGEYCGRGWTWQRSELGTAHWLTDRYAGWLQATWRRTGVILFRVIVQRMGVVVAKDLEHDRLCLQVLDEGLGNGHRDVLHVVEAEWSRSCVLYGLRGEGLLVLVEETKDKRTVNEGIKREK